MLYILQYWFTKKLKYPRVLRYYSLVRPVRLLWGFHFAGIAGRTTVEIVVGVEIVMAVTDAWLAWVRRSFRSLDLESRGKCEGDSSETHLQ
jgi:hypothetical protein